MQQKPSWPYNNLSLDDLPGEEWKPVPGYENQYLVSSLGRIKSLKRWRNAGPGGGYYSTELIRKPRIITYHNQSIDKPAHSIGITLKKNGVLFSTSTARYVYHAFVQPFNLDNPDLLISFKDLDGRNLHYKNLLLTGRSKLAIRSYQLQRSRSKNLPLSS